MRPIVSVIVPVFNDRRSLAVLLRALADQDFPRERFECLVIDNGSAELIGIPPGCPLTVRVLREGEPGSYAARNRGLREARGDIVAFTDADCIPRNDWLSRAVDRIQAAQEPAMIAGHVEVTCLNETQDSDSPWSRIFQWHSVANDLNQRRFVSRFHFAATANLITTKDVFQRTGPFDAHLYSGGDVEWGQRAWSLGIQQIFADDVVVHHPARSNLRSLVAKTRRIAGGHYALNSRTGRPLLTTVAMTLNIAAASLSRSWLDPRLPTVGCRLGVILVELSLRTVQLCEVMRLGLGGRALNC